MEGPPGIMKGQPEGDGPPGGDLLCVPALSQPDPKVQGLMHHWLGAVAQGLQWSEGWCS